MKRARYPAFALLLLCGLALSAGTASTVAAEESGAYAVIRFIGNHNTRIAFADGHIEYADTLLAGSQAPSHVDIRMYQTIQLINALAKRGYVYAGKFNNGEQIVMKKLR
jgi:hypothetical protein